MRSFRFVPGRHCAGGLPSEQPIPIPVAGLDPATDYRPLASMGTPDNTQIGKGGCVYIMTNRQNGTLYVEPPPIFLGEHGSIELVSSKDLQNNTA
jgi:hypothetical protein